MVEELLIEKVRGYDCLYNTKHEDYRDSSVRQKAWKEIGKELHMPGTAAKEIWDKLRRCFTNARNRHRDGKKSDSGAKKKVVWKFEEQMDFLLPFLETRKTHSNLNETQCELQNDTTQLPDFETPQTDQITICPEVIDETAVVKHEVQCQQTAAVHVDGSLEMPPRKKRKEPSQNSSSAQHQLVDILKESSAHKGEKYEEKCQSQGSKCLEGLDETDLFFLSMSRMTKKLPKLEQARIKLQLSNLVLLAEIQEQESNYSNSDPTLII